MMHRIMKGGALFTGMLIITDFTDFFYYYFQVLLQLTGKLEDPLL